MGKIRLKRKLTHMLLPSVMIVLVVGIMLFSFSVFGETNARNQVVDRLEARVVLYGEMLTTTQRIVQEDQRVVARLWKGSGQEWQEALAALEESDLVYRALYVNTDGVAWDSMGRRNANLTREEFWKEWKEKEHMSDASSEMVEDHASRVYTIEHDVTGEHTLLAVYGLPDGAGDLLAFCLPQTLLAQTGKVRLGEKLVMALVDREGIVYAMDGGEESVFYQSREEFWDRLGPWITGGKGLDHLRIRLNNAESGYVSARKDGEERYFFYTPIGNGEVFLVAGVEADYVDAKSYKIYAPMQRILNTNTTLLVLLALVAYRYLLYVNKKDTENKMRLQERADKDLLTDLNNKLATERKIREYLESAPGEKGVMFVVDIDYFKKINDTMGHVFGDEVLRTFGKRICSEFRVSDIVGRVGGDEFIIFLRDVKTEEGIHNAGRKLENFFKGFEVGEYSKYSVTASMGAAVYPEDGDSFESLYHAADIALYESKKAGRNRLTFYHKDEENTKK